MSYLVNVDIGGTHTDGVAIDEQGGIIDGKVASTPNDFSKGFFDSLEVMAEKLGTDIEGLLEEAELVSHGTTVGTNAVLEGDDVDTSLITTHGAESVISMMRGAPGRTSGLSVEEYLHMQEVTKPDPLVPKENIHGLNERIDCKGEVVVEFNEEQARGVAKTIADEHVDSVAISCLWSFLNSEHEERMEEILTEELDEDVFLTRSSDLAPTWGEYERTTATAINALIGPTTSDYIEKIDNRLEESGYDGTLLVMQVGGGVAPAADAIREPVRTIDSGPAAGMTGCSYLADTLDHENIIAGDMGGTSFDVGLITDGEPITKATNVVRQYDYSIRNIDIESIGNGGGSIAWVEENTGRLRVGPQSAGADPGPACYGDGGDAFTVTDAAVLCGFIDPEYFLGGREELDLESAEEAARGLMKATGMDLMDVARGVVEISNAQMADLISQRTINKGHDPRNFTIYAYGGAGPLYLPSIAHRLSVDEVVIPTGDSSSVWSAVGISSSDVLHRNEMSNMRTFAPFDPEELTEQFTAIEDEIRGDLEAEGFDEEDMRLERYANLSYGLQVHEVTVPVPPGELTEEDTGEVIARFEKKYEQLYGEGAGASQTGFELVTLRVDGYGKTTKPNLRAETSGVKADGGNPETEEIFWPAEDRYMDTKVYYQDDIGPGMTFEGPAVMRLNNTTVAVPSADSGEIDEYNNIIIRS
ncbi:hydantoinase/oxoprolinase family protein [Natrinema gelatinilyticum]|uniref:hydantoinase/oxoprolinase family protein n=1 Tax=Natrinema gelatinilyticum TaxID=2961571 RepID=UPI0020C2F880|nr:hydantoinase/oxoprolinase family protein [Natrinema gelatinilyticum]